MQLGMWTTKGDKSTINPYKPTVAAALQGVRLNQPKQLDASYHFKR
jgi:hypothetical protein